MHLAEINIAKWQYAPDDPRGRDFFAALDAVNAAAERMPGFVWRLVGEGNDATDITVFDDPRVLVNVSVWQSVADLEKFVWNTIHKRVYDRKNKWFMAPKEHYLAMWWVEPGHVPTLEEAQTRLRHLQEHGNSDHAFDWSHLPHVKLWQSQRCG